MKPKTAIRCSYPAERQKMEREVEIGLQNGVYVEIKSGLEAGETW